VGLDGPDDDRIGGPAGDHGDLRVNLPPGWRGQGLGGEGTGAREQREDEENETDFHGYAWFVILKEVKNPVAGAQRTS